MALALTLVDKAPAQSEVRGRDPWTIRMILEKKTRMLVLALKPDLWTAYNPANCTLDKVWSGGIDFRVKVWDFSSQNSVTQGTSYYLLENASILSAINKMSIAAEW